MLYAKKFPIFLEVYILVVFIDFPKAFGTLSNSVLQGQLHDFGLTESNYA